MRVNKAEKYKSRLRILSSAARMFRERGIENTNLGEVMMDAGMTQGGFYRHFETKDALLEEVIEFSFRQNQSEFKNLYQKTSAENTLECFRAWYLSKGHVDNPGQGCPIAALGGEISRASSDLKKSFTEGVIQTIELMAKGKTGTPEKRSEAAMRDLALMVGAVVLARGCEGKISHAVLKACK